jgi:transposase
MKTSPSYSPEVRERAVRLVREHQGGHDSQRAAIVSIASKIGYAAEALRRWVRQTEKDRGQGDGLSSAERERREALEREVRELRQANERSCARPRPTGGNPKFASRSKSRVQRSTKLASRTGTRDIATKKASASADAFIVASKVSLARPTGFEPVTPAFGGLYSIQLSYGRFELIVSLAFRPPFRP